MKNKRREDLDFDFDVKQEKKPDNIPVSNEYSLEPKTKINKRIRIENLTFDANEDCLVVRRRSGTTKEKTLVALDEIESTQVKKVSKPILLFLAIFFLVVCGVAAYPLYLLLENNLYVALGVAGGGLVLFLIFLIIYLSTRRLSITINFSTSRNIKYYTSHAKLFDEMNNFMDELFHLKHEIFRKR